MPLLRRFRTATPVVTAAATLLGLAAACTSGATSSHAADAGVSAARAPLSTSTTRAPFSLSHLVVVVEENHAYSGVVGSPAAPYINRLIGQGALATRSYGVTHPSEPNYVALFSGSTHGLTDDSCPHRFSGPTLAGELLAAHRSFAAYSESLPSTGWTGCSAGAYARKHAPWTNFPSVPRSVAKPFSAFPSNYAALPAVSFVVPNLNHDMHDGSVQQGDSWLRNNLGRYASWARSHNSALLVTWDEDDSGHGNHIATLLVGAHVRHVRYSGATDHYRVLRTIEWLFGVPPIGTAARRAPLAPVFG